MENNNLSQFSDFSNNDLSFHEFKNINYVEQGKFKINKKPLFTKGLGTCSVMMFKVDKFYYLIHVDIDMNDEIILRNKKKKFDKKQLSKINNIYISSGKWEGYKNTRIIILKVINKLRMIDKIIEIKKIDHEDSIGINKKGIWIKKGF